MNISVVPKIKKKESLNKEEYLEKLLLKRILANAWAIGDRLPTERKIAEDFEVSRNTVRGALRRIETKGLIVAKRGSGYYLKSTYLINNSDNSPGEESYERIMARLEAAYLFLPGVVSIATVNISNKSLAELEECTVNLSRAIFSRNIGKFKKQARSFFQIIAASTENQIIEEVVSSFCASSSLMFPDFFSFAEVQQKKLFADYVLIFNAMKNREVQESVQRTKKKIINTSVALSELKKIQLPQTIEAARQEIS